MLKLPSGGTTCILQSQLDINVAPGPPRCQVMTNGVECGKRPFAGWLQMQVHFCIDHFVFLWQAGLIRNARPNVTEFTESQTTNQDDALPEVNRGDREHYSDEGRAAILPSFS